MKKYSLLLLSTLFLAACSGSGGNSGEGDPAAGNGVDNTSTPVTQNPNGNVDPADVEPVSTVSRIKGEITLFNGVSATSDILINVRDTDISGFMQANGEFELELPKNDRDRTVVLDISGPEVITDSVSVPVPADIDLVLVSTDLSGRAPPITFSLDNGGEMTNALSPTRVSVTVPPNAFEFEDGTLAVGPAEVRITEIDIEDLNGESAWAPNLMGINEDTGVTSALVSLGMSDFHFSQNGRELQLRPGMTATIKADMVSTSLVPNGGTEVVEADVGMAVGLWYYDTHDMIWKEEGESFVVADNESETGLSLSGEVSHFSIWNYDYGVPWTNIMVHVRLVDENGNEYTDLNVSSHKVDLDIVSSQGSGWSYESNWSNSEFVLGSSSEHEVWSSVQGGPVGMNGTPAVNSLLFSAGTTTIDFVISNVTTSGNGYATVSTDPVYASKNFSNNSSGDSSITIDIPVVLHPPEIPVNVVLKLIDFSGKERSDLSVANYNVTATSDYKSVFVNTQQLTPVSPQMNVQANEPQRIASNQPVTMKFLLNSLELLDLGAVKSPNEVTKSSIIRADVSSDHTVTLIVLITDL